MTTSERRRKLYAEYEKQLTPFSTSLVAEFVRSADAVGDLLSDEELEAWAEDGLELARQSWRSWEAAGEYFRVAPQLLPMLGMGRVPAVEQARPRASGAVFGAGRVVLPGFAGDAAFDHVRPARRLGQPREAAVQGHLALGFAGRAVLRREPGSSSSDVAGGGARARALRRRAVRPVVRPRLALP